MQKGDEIFERVTRIDCEPKGKQISQVFEREANPEQRFLAESITHKTKLAVFLTAGHIHLSLGYV